MVVCSCALQFERVVENAKKEMHVAVQDHLHLRVANASV
jgi:hypothetical protein